MSNYELGVIGGGNMGGAVITVAINTYHLPAEKIVVSALRDQRRAKLEHDLHVTCQAGVQDAASAPHVLLSVKPQVVHGMAEMIRPHLRDDALVVSILAGVDTASLDAMLGGKGRIVRAMPNTPLLVGSGMSAICAGPRATEADVEWVSDLLGCGGRTVIVEESQMDAVTAVSGSGPAYMFYLVEAMIAAGVAEGLSESDARLLASQTCLGAGGLLMEAEEDPAALRRRVTSPGGTTQEAIETMEREGIFEGLVASIRAAAKRSRELGKS